MRGVVVLLDIKSAVLEFNHSSFVVIDITVVWSTEDCNNSWEVTSSAPFVKLVSLDLGLMSTNNRN